MSCIYYMWARDTNVGYIGQDTTSNTARIIDHIKSAFTEKPDSAGHLILDYGIDNLCFWIFGEDHPAGPYGIPQSIYDGFLKQWKPESGYALIDIAEILHILHARLAGTEASRYNVLIGGFQAYNMPLIYNPDVTETAGMPSDVIDQLRKNFQAQRFSVNLAKDPQGWHKFVYPLGYLALADVVLPAIETYLYGPFLDLIFSDPAVENLFAEYAARMLAESVIKPGKPLDKATAQEFNSRLISLVSQLINSKQAGLANQIKTLVHQTLGSRYTKVFKIAWRPSQKTIDEVTRPIINRMQNMSLRMWANVISAYENTSRRKVISLDGRRIMQRNAAEEGPRVTSINWNLAHSIVSDFQYDPTVVPQWATELKNLALVGQTFPQDKIIVCQAIMSAMMPLIDRAKIDVNGFDPKRDYLYSRVLDSEVPGVNKKIFQEARGGRADFMHGILTIWHKVRYGDPDWITLRDWISENPDLAVSLANTPEHQDYITNARIISNYDPMQAVWYSGKKWAAARDVVDSTLSSNTDYAMGVALAQLWTWNNPTQK